jgi:hypothetical protein
VLVKLQCATRCIRYIVPEGEDPEQACDIELRFVFAMERDVRRLMGKPLQRQDTRKTPSRDVGTVDGAGRVTFATSSSDDCV